MEHYQANLTWRKVLLLSLSLILTNSLSAQIPNIWINEIHYDNTGTDAGEAVEIVVETFGDFKSENVAVHLYNGGNSRLYATHSLSQEAPGNNYDGFSIFTIETPDIQNGNPDGIALSYDDELIQFLSYGGTITAEDGVAAGFTSVDILVEESGETPLGHSLQLTETGDKYEAFVWTEASPETFGAPNNGQLLKVIDGPQPVTEFRVIAVAPDKVNLAWNKPIGIHGEDWSGVLIFGSKDGPNSVDFESKDITDFTGSTVFGEGGTVTENGQTLLRTQSNADRSVTVTNLNNIEIYHFAASTYLNIAGGDNDKFLEDLEEIEVSPKVVETSNYEATPLNGKARLSWSNPKAKLGDWWHEVMIIASENTVASVPTTANYNTDARFGEGDTPVPGEFVVYQGTDSVAFVEGLENNKDYYFKIFVRYDTEEAFYWSAGVETTAQPNLSTKYWSGGAGNNLFSADANWQPVGAPNASHDVILDNSIVPEAYEVISSGDDEIHLNSLAISPENTSIRIKFSSITDNSRKIVLHDNQIPLSISNSGVLINNITNSNGTIVLPNGEMVVEAEGKYVHNTGSGSTSILDRIKLIDNYIPGIIEFNNSRGFISLAGRTFNELIFASASSTSYSSAPGSVPFTIKKALSIDQNSSLNLTNLSAPLYLEGDLNMEGNITFDNNLILNGAGEQSLSGMSETPVQINNLLVDKPGNNLRLATDLLVKNKLEFIRGNIETGDNSLILDYSSGDNPKIVGAPTNGKIIGNLEVTKNVASEEVEFEHAGVNFKPGTGDLGIVTVIRSAAPQPDLAGASAVINRSWTLSSSQQPTASRQIAFTWDAEEENDLDLLNVQLWQESEISDEWLPIGDPQDGTSRTLTANVNRLSQFVISDINNPLPVTLLSFEAVLHQKNALLQWVILNETNNAGFEIEKSIDGKQFYKIGFVNGRGTSLAKTNYEFKDFQLNEKSFYRLRQLDYDGSYAYSPIRFLSPTATSIGFSVYPNPIDKYITIKTGNEVHVDSCYLINSLGVTIYETSAVDLAIIEKEINMILGDLQSGVYLLKLAQKSGAKNIKLLKK